MYAACILNVSRMSLRYVDLWMHLRYMYLMMYFRCITHVSWSPLQIHVSQMYLECISHVSCISVTYLWTYSRYAFQILYPACIPFKIHVSWFCISMYLDVSWLRVQDIQDTRILMYPDVSWYVSSVTPRKRPRYMYPDVSDVYLKMYLGLFWDTCKIHAKCQDMYSLGM